MSEDEESIIQSLRTDEEDNLKSDDENEASLVCRI